MFCIEMGLHLDMRVSELCCFLFSVWRSRLAFSTYASDPIQLHFSSHMYIQPPISMLEQVQNPIHFEKLSDTEFKATIKASETFTICCGRNIAFISEIPNRNAADGLAIDRKLHALTWVDPVTTEEVSYPKITEIKGGVDTERRRLESKKRSSIHGTNGYLVPLHSTNELLGIAHFHRPEHRQQSDYARHGHHYSELEFIGFPNICYLMSLPSLNIFIFLPQPMHYLRWSLQDHLLKRTIK